MPGYNYSFQGLYFVTINVYNREPAFGEIINGEMMLNEYGKIAIQCWDELPDHIGYCELDKYVVMPDHFHGIVIIPAPVGNRHACSLQESPQYMKLPVIIGSYKSAVSKLIHMAGRKDFRWQKSYHDRIIRDQNELNAIREYIRQNPERWR